MVMETIPECEIIEYNVQDDHIHGDMIIPPKFVVSEVMEDQEDDE